jgi:hypothetical protein
LDTVVLLDVVLPVVLVDPDVPTADCELRSMQPVTVTACPLSWSDDMELCGDGDAGLWDGGYVCAESARPAVQTTAASVPVQTVFGIIDLLTSCERTSVSNLQASSIRRELRRNRRARVGFHD